MAINFSSEKKRSRGFRREEEKEQGKKSTLMSASHEERDAPQQPFQP